MPTAWAREADLANSCAGLTWCTQHDANHELSMFWSQYFIVFYICYLPCFPSSCISQHDSLQISAYLSGSVCLVANGERENNRTSATSQSNGSNAGIPDLIVDHWHWWLRRHSVRTKHALHEAFAQTRSIGLSIRRQTANPVSDFEHTQL